MVDKTGNRIGLLLCLDVGNTQTVAGVISPTNREILAQWRVRTSHDRTGDEYTHLLRDLLRGDGIEPSRVAGVAVSCVVPQAIRALHEMSRRAFGLEPLMVGPGMKSGMPILYDNPREVGADRIVNAVAAYERFHRPLVVIDFGTAITFDVVSGKGEYLGGAIVPGLQIAVDALFSRAAKLPQVELAVPDKVVGKDTVASIQSGILFGYASLVDGLVARIEAETGVEHHVVATGGMAEMLAGEAKSIREVLPDLTLEGLALLWERNR
jgi:type III pantothenate kinase